MIFGETVAAVSTPPGKGGVALIRISGEDAVSVADKMFRPAGSVPLREKPPRLAVFGSILYEGKEIDTGIATVFRAPASFTGEDTVELCCHGGVLLAKTVLESAFLCGASPAGPGEFTKRAFLNGKLSLSQAEAVMELIEAESTEKIKLASAQSRGVLSKKLDSIASRLNRLLASTYAYIDYPDEDLTDVDVPEMTERIEECERELTALLATYKSGKAIAQGIRTAIVGKPNVGKSSVLNLLLGEERAIVTSVAGTTRDTIEETAVLGRVMLRLCDTAGIRTTEDEVERLGVARACEKLNEAELILAVFDASRPMEEDDRVVLDRVKKAKENGAEVIVLLNKCDLPEVLSDGDFADAGKVLRISAKNGGFGAISDAVEEMFLSGQIEYDTTAILSSARQFAQLTQARDSLRSALDALKSGMTQDMAGLDLEQALARIGETDGRQVTVGITDEIFSHFCVGK